MIDIEEKIQKIREEIRDTPYHKGTEHHIGRLKAKIARLENLREAKSKKSGGGKGSFTIKKTGDAQVVLIGPPSVGKSTLLNKLTRAKSAVGAYDFTTVTVIPGMMEYKEAHIQLLDLPGIIEGASLGKGRGRQILSAARGADLLIVMTDIHTYKTLDSIVNELNSAGIRINQEAPLVFIKKKPSGGLHIRYTKFKNGLYSNLVKDIAVEFRLVNAEIIIKEEIDTSRLIDAFSLNRVFIPCLFVINKFDLQEDFVLPNEFKSKFSSDYLLISADKDINLPLLKEKIWQKLNLINIYLRPKNSSNYDNLIVKKGITVSDLAEKISSERVISLKGALVWDDKSSTKFRRVGKNQTLSHDQVIRLIY